MRSWAFEESPDPVIAFDRRGRIRAANKAARRAFRLDGDRVDEDGALIRLLPGRYARRLFQEGEIRFSPDLAERMGRHRWRATALRADGSEFPIEATVKRAPSAFHEIYLAFVRDVSDRVRERQEMMRAKEEAVLASTAKSEFLANMSHEIRTPLNAVIGMTDLLAETPLEEDQRRYVSICRRAGRTLLAVVNDVLDLSKIEAGQLQLERIDFDLHALVETVAELMALRAHEKDLNFAVRIAPDSPQMVRGDPNRVRQIALNLLGNAIKFTGNGEVSLELSRLAPEGGAKLCVRDSGVGMQPEFLARIFDKFSQADSSITRRHGGTGLGLAISKRLADAMGGGIEVSSRPGEGSEFVVRLPLEASDRIRLVKSPRWYMDLQGTDALIVDESPASRQAIAEALEAWGARAFSTSAAREAESALAAARAAGRPFRLVLASLRSIGPDADAFLRSARKGASPEAMVFLMANERRGAAHAPVAGADATIVRPVKRSELMEAIARCQSRVGSARFPGTVADGRDLGEGAGDAAAADRSGASGAGESNGPGRGRRSLPRAPVLLVEDSADNRALVQAFLKTGGFELDVAEDGAEGAERAKSRRYGLILMDMQMPVMDGYAATREIRKWERERRADRTPILALTAHALREEVRRCLDAGCDGHIAKPVNKAQLLEAIEIFAKGVEANGHAGADERPSLGPDHGPDHRPDHGPAYGPSRGTSAECGAQSARGGRFRNGAAHEGRGAEMGGEARP